MNTNKVWMGIGLYQSYLDNIATYISWLQDNGEVILIIVDEPQSHNAALHYAEGRQCIKEQLSTTIGNLIVSTPNIVCDTFNSISVTGRYRAISKKVKELYATDAIFRDRVKHITRGKTKISEKDPAIDELAGYTLDEITSIYYMAERKYTKAGHEGEKEYDSLARKTLHRCADKLQLSITTHDMAFMYCPTTAGTTIPASPDAGRPAISSRRPAGGTSAPIP